MPKIFNHTTVEKHPDNPVIDAYRWQSTVDLAKASGLTDFSCNIRVLERGTFSCPYHFHHNADEMFVILEGKGELRTPEGITPVVQGDVIFFERGESGSHQLHNAQEEPLVFLDLRTLHTIDICEYPDTGKVNILPKRDTFYRGESVDYYPGEEDIVKVWKDLKSE